MTDNRQAELDRAVEELKALEAAVPQDGDAVAKANAKVDALRKALTEPVKPEPVEPAKPVFPNRKF